MTCRDIPSGSAPSYDTVQQMYVGLGVRRLPTGVHMNVDSNLPSSGLNLAVLTPEALACFNTYAGITGGSGYNNSSLHGNVRELRELIDYFRGAGNSGDVNVITGEEIDAYVTAYGQGRENFNAQEYRDLTVSNIAAYISIVQYMGGGDAAAVPSIAQPNDSISTAIRTYGSVQQMYTGLSGDVVGAGPNATRSSVAEDVPSDGIPLGVLTEANIQRFANAIGWDPTQDPTTPLGRNAKEILELVDYFRGDGNLEGGDPAIITSAEIDAYVRAYVEQARSNGDRSITFDSYRAVTVGNLRAIVGSIQYISNPPALTIAPADAGAPTDGGPRVVAETPGDGGNTHPVVPPPANNNAGAPSWLPWAIGGGVATLLTGIGLGWLFRGNRGGTPPPTGGNTPPRADNNPPRADNNPPRADNNADTQGSRRSSNPPPPPAKGGGNAGNQPPPPKVVVAAEDDMSGVLDALSSAKGNQTPGNAPVVAAPAAVTLVTADNVIIEGPNAAPVNGVDPAVIRNQVVLHYRRFLSQTAREALQDGRQLPTGTELVNSRFDREVTEITDRIVAEYYARNKAGTLSDLWDAQRDRGYFVRRGVPERLLLEVANGYIDEHATHASSPFSGGEGAAIRTEAERDAGEGRFLRDGMREILRMGRP